MLVIENWLLAQIWSFVAALLAGALAALFFELYQNWLGKKWARRRRRVCLLLDAAFAGLLSLFFCCWWFLLTDGSLRCSVFLWIALGWCLCSSWRRKLREK